MEIRHSRRGFLRVTLGLTGIPALPPACSPAAAPPPTTAPVPAAPKPTTAPQAAAPTTAAAATGPTPAPPAATAPANAPPGGSTGTPAVVAGADGKLPSPMVGVPDGYLKLPPIAKSYDGVPGRGGQVNVFTIAYHPPPTPRDATAGGRARDK